MIQTVYSFTPHRILRHNEISAFFHAMHSPGADNTLSEISLGSAAPFFTILIPAINRNDSNYTFAFFSLALMIIWIAVDHSGGARPERLGWHTPVPAKKMFHHS